MIFLNILFGINALVFLVMLFIPCSGCEEKCGINNLTKKQWIFWTVLSPGLTLGYLLAKIIRMFFKWLATDNKKNKTQNSNYCYKCKYYNEGECKTLDISIESKQLCNGKLYER